MLLRSSTLQGGRLLSLGGRNGRLHWNETDDWLCDAAVIAVNCEQQAGQTTTMKGQLLVARQCDTDTPPIVISYSSTALLFWVAWRVDITNSVFKNKFQSNPVKDCQVVPEYF